MKYDDKILYDVYDVENGCVMKIISVKVHVSLTLHLIELIWVNERRRKEIYKKFFQFSQWVGLNKPNQNLTSNWQ